MLGYVEQLGTFVEVKVGGLAACMGHGWQGAGAAGVPALESPSSGVGGLHVRGGQARVQAGVDRAVQERPTVCKGRIGGVLYAWVHDHGPEVDSLRGACKQVGVVPWPASRS